MIPPYEREECPACKGEGFFQNSCPFPPDTEVDCEHCHLKTSCGHAEECDLCEGKGWVTAEDLAYIAKTAGL